MDNCFAEIAGLVNGKRMRLLVVMLLLLLGSSPSFSLEKRQGIVRSNQSIQCANRCDEYYLSPDPFNAFIYLKPDGMTTIDLAQYRDAHVEVTGYQAGCSVCTDLIVTDIRLLPPVTFVGDIDASSPTTTALLQNYPNPFNPTTTIMYDLGEDAQVQISIFNVLGTEVARLAFGIQSPGRHEARWDASGKPDGLYFCRLRAVNRSGRMVSFVEKMSYVK